MQQLNTKENTGHNWLFFYTYLRFLLCVYISYRRRNGWTKHLRLFNYKMSIYTNRYIKNIKLDQTYCKYCKNCAWNSGFSLRMKIVFLNIILIRQNNLVEVWMTLVKFCQTEREGETVNILYISVQNCIELCRTV